MRAHEHAASEQDHPREMDWLLLAVVLLCCVGLIMAVSIQGARPGASAMSAMKVQGTKLAAGFAVFLGFAIVPLDLLRRHANKTFWIGTVLVFAAALLGRPVNGACRWIQVAGLQFQPVDLARLCLILFVAARIADAGTGIRRFRPGFVDTLWPALLLAAGLLLQPDNGNALMSIALVACMALVGGVPFRHYSLLGVPMLLLVLGLAATQPYVQSRLSGFLDVQPGTQVGQSLVAIGSGGVLGQGLGNGWMKMGFVPEAHNDFVFAIVGEELGLIGSLAVVCLFCAIGFFGMRLVLSSQDKFHRILILGLVLAICMQATVNLLVVTGMAPPKGIDLPFVSSGGTNLVFCLAATGLIGNAARAARNGPRARSSEWEG